jgi:hypothetical protein
MRRNLTEQAPKSSPSRRAHQKISAQKTRAIGRAYCTVCGAEVGRSHSEPRYFAVSPAGPSEPGASPRGRTSARKKPHVNRWLAQSGRFRNPLIIRGSRQSSRVRLGPPPRLVFLSPGEIKRTSGSRIEPVLDDESAKSAVFQRSVVSHQRGLVLDRGTRDHQIKVALLPAVNDRPRRSAPEACR